MSNLTTSSQRRSRTGKVVRVLGPAAAALAALLLPTLVARASRNVHVPGTACSPIKADVDKINYGAYSAINESTSSAKVVCPVQFASDTVNRPSNMFIRVIDRSTSADVSCTLFAFADGGLPGSVFQHTAKSSGVVDPNTGLVLQDINEGNDEGIVLTTAPGWVFTMTCTLPGATSSSKRSEVVNYQLGQGT